METLAAIIFVVMYMVIVSEKIHRTVAAMIGAVLMMLLGILSQEVALHHVDFETLGLLVGMMVLVGVTKETGLFDYVAIKAAKSAKAEPRRILVYLCVITAVFSAFLDNVTTVLLMVPVTFSITKILKLDPMPYLLTQIIASNIGGTATLIGDPPNIMIGSAVKELTFVMFIEHLAPIAIICMTVVLFIMSAIYRKSLVTTGTAGGADADGREGGDHGSQSSEAFALRAGAYDPRLFHTLLYTHRVVADRSDGRLPAAPPRGRQ